MNYLVFRILASGEPQLIGKTRYENDAQHLLKNWHSGFIQDKRGRTIHQKNCPTNVKKEQEDGKS